MNNAQFLSMLADSAHFVILVWFIVLCGGCGYWFSAFLEAARPKTNAIVVVILSMIVGVISSLASMVVLAVGFVLISKVGSLASVYILKLIGLVNGWFN